MRIIGVIDVAGGRAVHARGGERETYAPVAMAAGVPVGGDVSRLARVYVEQLRVDALYVACLDAIERGLEVLDAAAIGRVAALGVPTWVDAGARTADEALRVLAAGATHVIIGLETLSSFDAISATCAAVGGRHVVFSLDLRAGVPLTAPNADHADRPLEELARRAADAGVEQAIVLDVARVGMRGGPDFAQLATVRRAMPGVDVFAGGGIRSDADLAALEAAGCTGALMATALFDGTVKPGAGTSPTARSSPRLPSRSP